MIKFPHRALIPIQPSNASNMSILCVPGAGGNITSFLPFADSFDSKASLYGLQPRGLEELQLPHNSVRAAAKAYVTEICEAQLTEPYYLVGHSFGSWIAFEMALQLTDIGRTVKLLSLIDADVPTALVEGVETRIDALSVLIKVLEQAYERSLNVGRDVLAELNELNQVNLLHTSMMSAGMMPVQSNVRIVEGLVRTFITHARTPYIPSRSFEGNVLLFQAEEQDDSGKENITDSEAEWFKYASNLKVEQVSGNHMTILQKPNVVAIAKRILVED